MVVVQLFAGARELAGVGSLSFNLPAGSSVAELREAMAGNLLSLAALVARSRIAVNQEFADDSAIVPEGAEVALIPPVSGGGAP